MSHIFNCTGCEVYIPDIIRGENCYLYDSQGRRYTDFEAGVWCTALGHNHEGINEVIRSQMERIMHVGYRYHDIVVEEAAEALLGTVRLSGGKCVFLSSGSEAVELGVQMARRISGKPLFLTLSDAYLAAFGSAGKKSRDEWVLLDWRGCAACPYTTGCNPECQVLREIPWEQLGGWVFEPGNSSGTVKLPPQQLVRFLDEMVGKRQGLLVVDEVTTGMGRTGVWYGYEHYGLKPDFIAVGKGLGNGYPISAVMLTGEVAVRVEQSGFRYAQSHQNDALGCAVAREVIGVLREEGLIERSRDVGGRFLNHLEQLAPKYNCIREVRGRGLMIAVEFQGDYDRFSLASVHRDLLERGFVVGFKPVANLLRFYPALTIEEEEIESMVGNLEEILSI